MFYNFGQSKNRIWKFPESLLGPPVGTQDIAIGRVSLPGIYRLQSKYRSARLPFASKQENPLRKQQKDVLVVEDEIYLRDLIADVLEADGHRALTASNGLDALRVLEEHRPQLILLDLMMPVMDGREFMSQIKKHEEWLDIPVIIITAIYDIRDTIKETGAQAVITKPFDIDQISEIVNQFAS